ncbi:MAG: hypothetical protein GC205_05555 [Bacteroidetes bacterium]|nr:hypothetical protein [Bacteroidota bacterium]
MELLPVFAWLLAFGILQRRFPRSAAFGLSGLAAYAWALLSVEGLCAIGQLDRTGAALSWLLFASGFIALRFLQPAALPRYRRHPSAEERWLCGFAVVSGGIVLGIGLLAAPNNWDSMTYHLPRVMQWATRGSVGFYETGISRQLSQPPGSEYALLHLYLLSGSDRLFGAVQGAGGWMAAAAVWRIALLLGATRLAAAWGVFVLAATPMAVLQASSTQNDLVLAALLAWTLAFGLQFLSGRRVLFGVAAVLAASLAVASKGTALVLLPPMLVLLLVLAVSRRMWRALWLLPLGAFLLVLFAGPQLLRNQQAFGSALGPDYGLANLIAQPGDALLGTFSNVAKNTAFALRTPLPAINALLERAVHSLHAAVGLDVNDGRFHWPASPGFSVLRSGPGQWLHEDYAPNMMPAWLLVVGFASVLVTRLARRARERLGEESPALISMGSYVLLLLASWVLFSALLRWQIWHSRLLLPLAVLAAPWLGFWLSRQRFAVRVAAAFLLVLGVLPALLANRSRPLLGPDSILVTPRQEQYFVNRPEVYEGYREAAAALREHGAQHSLLYLSGDSWEYPLWVLAQPDAPLRSGQILAKGERVPGTELPNGQPAGFSGPALLGESGALRPATAPTLLLCWKEELLARDTLVLAEERFVRRGAMPLAGAPGVYVLAGFSGK